MNTKDHAIYEHLTLNGININAWTVYATCNHSGARPKSRDVPITFITLIKSEGCELRSVCYVYVV